MFTTAAIKSLNDRLNSSDWDVVWDAAIETFVKSERSAAELFILGKAAHTGATTPNKSFNDFIKSLRRAGFDKSDATVKNYRYAWDLAAVTVAENVDPTPEHMAMAYRIITNVKSAARAEWMKTMPESVTDRGAWLEAAHAEYKSMNEKYLPKSEPIEPDVEPEVEDIEPEVKGNGFDGQLSVLTTLAGRIQRGDFSVAEAAQLAHAAKGILAAAEALANEAVRTTVAA